MLKKKKGITVTFYNIVFCKYKDILLVEEHISILLQMLVLHLFQNIL